MSRRFLIFILLTIFLSSSVSQADDNTLGDGYFLKDGSYVYPPNHPLGKLRHPYNINPYFKKISPGASDHTYDFESKRSIPEASEPPTATIAEIIPENASARKFTRGWDCVRGFRRQDARCIAIEIPAFARLNSEGNDWQCEWGYQQLDNTCVAIPIPEHAQLDYYGNNWTCDFGYLQHEDRCEPLFVPANARLDMTGTNWTCRFGYQRDGETCIQTPAPENANLTQNGGWRCDYGYRKQGNVCEKIELPDNAGLNYLGSDWTCLRGYFKSDGACITNPGSTTTE